MTGKKFLFIGPIVQTIKNKSAKVELQIIEDAGVLVQDGQILEVFKKPEVSDIEADVVTKLDKGQFLVPGFIDCHVHAVQLPNIGLGYDKSLLDWLEAHTFPLELKYSDNEFADKVFDFVVKRTLSLGTTTACYFASLYNEASLILAKKAAKYHQRAFVGKLNMDRARDDNYYENKSLSIANTRKFIEDIYALKCSLVSPIITPRFALSCTMELLKELGKIAEEYNLHIQSHISENIGEIAECKLLFPDCPTYTEVYEKAKLLTSKTVLAHGVYLEDSELKILNNRKSAIIHCPSSNTNLKSGLCDIQRLRSNQITVGLGTDVAGGNNLCILDVMRSALQVSNHIGFMKDKSYKSINYVDVFYLATLGGAEALSIDDKVGNLVAGKKFDALVIDLNAEDSPVDNLKSFSLEDQLQRFIYSGDDRNIINVYVEGHKVK
ncbi:guanine deaminase [Microplitis mediator]|uniref:guanine deaminase n=1 Tax=Microplitis mediator TaxID=375433 RepID=UPI00255506A0|nr:guanine deaminase [Microplitis mediator]